jgi:hypothetical protein
MDAGLRSARLQVLGQVHTAVIPHMMHPVLLADFLTKSIDRRGLAGMLALNGTRCHALSRYLRVPPPPHPATRRLAFSQKSAEALQ